MVEFRGNFVRETKRGQMFLQTDTSSYVPENRNWIQPVVVFCCKHNIIMRIYIKIQLVVEFRLGFLRVYQRHPNTSETRSTARGSHGYDVSSFNVLVYWIVNHDKFNPRLYFRSVLCGWRNVDKYFLRPDMSSHASENRKWIQPVVVFFCKHNIIMRI